MNTQEMVDAVGRVVVVDPGDGYPQWVGQVLRFDSGRAVIWHEGQRMIAEVEEQRFGGVRLVDAGDAPALLRGRCYEIRRQIAAYITELERVGRLPDAELRAASLHLADALTKLIDYNERVRAEFPDARIKALADQE